MARTTHDHTLDHHGALDLTTAVLGADIGPYLSTDTIQSVVASLDERLNAVALGYNIRMGVLTAGAVIRRNGTTGTATADAVIA